MQKGFTLVETLIVIALIAVIGGFSFFSLVGKRNTASLTATTQQVGALLREAQSDSMTESQGAQWGVHLDNTTSTSAFYSLFYTFNATYASSTTSGHYALPYGICFATSTVAIGSSTNIIFSALSGAPSASTTITLQLMTAGGCGTASSSVTGGVSRTTSGKIFFDDFSRSNI